MTYREAIDVLKSELDGIPSDIDKSEFEQALNLTIKAVRIVEVIEAGFKRDSNLIMDPDDWKDIKAFVDKEAENEFSQN